MNDDHIGVGTIDAGRQDEIERSAAEKLIFPAEESVAVKPKQKLKKMRTRHGRDSVPINTGEVCAGEYGFRLKGQAFQVLGIEMDFAVVGAGKAPEEFAKSAFGTVAAVNEWGDDSKS